MFKKLERLKNIVWCLRRLDDLVDMIFDVDKRLCAVEDILDDQYKIYDQIDVYAKHEVDRCVDEHIIGETEYILDFEKRLSKIEDMIDR